MQLCGLLLISGDNVYITLRVWRQKPHCLHDSTTYALRPCSFVYYGKLLLGDFMQALSFSNESTICVFHNVWVYLSSSSVIQHWSSYAKNVHTHAHTLIPQVGFCNVCDSQVLELHLQFILSTGWLPVWLLIVWVKLIVWFQNRSKRLFSKICGFYDFHTVIRSCI